MIVVQNSKLLTSAVAGPYIVLYFQAAAIFVALAAFFALNGYRSTLERRFKKHLRRLRGQSSEVRSGVNSKASKVNSSRFGSRA